jgi:aspartokinase/homoserine dehydrogenase 1
MPMNYKITHVDGFIYCQSDLVIDAKKIDHLSFNEANEIANFGATILHAKIIPLLEKTFRSNFKYFQS